MFQIKIKGLTLPMPTIKCSIKICWVPSHYLNQWCHALNSVNFESKYSTFPSKKYTFENLGILPVNELTIEDRLKFTAILQTTFSYAFSGLKKIFMLFQITLVLSSPINKQSSLVESMAWCWTGSKPSSQPAMGRFHDATWYHQGGLLLTWINFNPNKGK